MSDGNLIDVELLAALGEGRLTSNEEARMVARLRGNPEARAELRDLFPERYDLLFGTEPVRHVLPFTRPGRRSPWVAAALAAGMMASFGLFWLAREVPVEGSGATMVQPPSQVRGGPSEPPRQLLVELGRPGFWDRMRGRASWAAAFAEDAGGRPVRLGDSSVPGGCTPGPETLACFVPGGMGRAAVVVAVEGASASPVLEALAMGAPDWTAFEAALRGEAKARQWALHFPGTDATP